MKSLICTLLLLMNTTSVSYAQTWSVVFGADRTIQAAQHEIKRANYFREYQNKGILVLRNGWYRSVIPFDNREQALREEGKINTALRKGSYIVDLDFWCRNWTKNPRTSEGIQYFECN